MADWCGVLDWGKGEGSGGMRYLLLGGGSLEAEVKVLGSLWGVLGIAVLAARVDSALASKLSACMVG